MLTLAVATLAVVLGVVGFFHVASLRARRRDAQVLSAIGTFGPVVERARSDPRILLTWYPIAQVARRIFPDAFAALDGDGAERFPFSASDLDAAHARWTADWLDWERSHDAESRQRSAEIEAALDQATEERARGLRARLEALEREKLERYQRRYEEYVQVSRALGNLSGEAARGGSPVIGSAD